MTPLHDAIAIDATGEPASPEEASASGRYALAVIELLAARAEAWRDDSRRAGAVEALLLRHLLGPDADRSRSQRKGGE